MKLLVVGSFLLSWPLLLSEVGLVLGAKPKRKAKRRKAKAESKSMKTSESSDEFCTWNVEDVGVMSDLFATDVSQIEKFLTSNQKTGIPEVQDFLQQVREAMPPEFQGNPSDVDILQNVMRHDSSTTAIGGKRELQSSLLLSATCEAAFVVMFIEILELGFAVVPGISKGLGGVVGNEIAERLFQNAGLVAKFLNWARSSSGGVGLIFDLFREMIVAVSLGSIMTILQRELDFWSWAVVVTQAVIEMTVLMVSGGASWIYKAALIATELAGVETARRSMETACAATLSPTPMATSAPVENTQSPTPSPTPFPPLPDFPSFTWAPLSAPIFDTSDGHLSGVFGDPHISTFDRLRFDCQAAGEFVMVRSLQSAFAVHERFTAVGSDQCAQASVSTGIAIREESMPTVQLSVPTEPTGAMAAPNVFDFGSATCGMDLFVGGSPSQLTDDVDADGIQISAFGATGVLVDYVDTGVQVLATLRYSATFGCHFTAQVFLPFSYRSDETLIGLLGKPNGDPMDDWVLPSGMSVESPVAERDRVFKSSYEYCVLNWCISTVNESIFTLRDGETFEAINQCSVSYDESIETAIQDAIINNAALVDICGEGNLFCLLDGVCGTLEDAFEALEEENVIEQAQLLVGSHPPTPTSVPSRALSAVPSVAPTSPATPHPSVVPSTSSAPSNGSKSSKASKSTKAGSRVI